jgi:hypothetical protein
MIVSFFTRRPIFGSSTCAVLGPPSTSHLYLQARAFSVSLPRFKKKMPPKKAAGPEKKALLGRPGNNLKIGIVGLFVLTLCYLISSSLFRSPERWEVVVF